MGVYWTSSCLQLTWYVQWDLDISYGRNGSEGLLGTNHCKRGHSHPHTVVGFLSASGLEQQSRGTAPCQGYSTHQHIAALVLWASVLCLWQWGETLSSADTKPWWSFCVWLLSFLFSFLIQPAQTFEYSCYSHWSLCNWNCRDKGKQSSLLQNSVQTETFNFITLFLSEQSLVRGRSCHLLWEKFETSLPLSLR